MKIIFKFIQVVVLGATSACSISGPGDDGQEATRKAIVRSAADRVLAPAYAEASTALSGLADAARSYADAVAGGEADPQAKRDAARVAFGTAMDAWQRVEMLLVGPAGPAGLVTGGESLRDEIYSFPVTNRCRIDEELAEGSFEEPNFFTANLVNVRGLDAVEYLLFVEGTDNACDATRPINKDGTWQALGADEIVRRRAEYAARAAEDAAARAAALASRWSPGTGDAYAAFVSAGEAGSPYPTTRVALDEFSSGLFDLDTHVKDRKLAAHAPEELESPLSARSKENVLANLAAAREIFYAAPSAGEGTGYDDWLANVGQASLVADVDAAFAAAEAAVRAVPGSFETALADDPNALLGAQSAVGDLAALLKGPFLAALDLMPPADGAGDAD